MITYLKNHIMKHINEVEVLKNASLGEAFDLVGFSCVSSETCSPHTNNYTYQKNDRYDHQSQ